MYNDALKVANKIVTYDDLVEIFSRMQEILVQYQKTYNIEDMKNKMLDYNYQIWTFKDLGSKLSFNVDFYDDTHITFDNYNNFIAIFHSRLEEIKSMNVLFTLSYETQTQGNKREYYHQNISMWISENKIDISVSLNSNDDKLSDIYSLIKNKILNSQPKYDDIIKRKWWVSFIVTFGIGLIPSLVISTLLLFLRTIREIYSSYYIVYPLISLFLAFIIGGVIGNSKLDKCYKHISPEKKYAGYDSYKGSSIYKDDIDQYITTSEILIGKNANNLEYRKEIKYYMDKFKKFIPYELVILLVMSLIVVFF